MSYLAQAVAGLVIGLVVFVGVPFLALLLIFYAIMMFVYAAQNFPPGTVIGRCSTWGHDFHRQLPGLPPGATCRNCLVRKDRVALGWRMKVPSGVPTMHIPWAGLVVPHNTAAEIAKRAPPAFIILDEPGTPRVPVGTAAPAAPARGALKVASIAPAKVPLPRAAPETLCKRCFALLPPGVPLCPLCGAPRA